jgi:hypothetical protein
MSDMGGVRIGVELWQEGAHIGGGRGGGWGGGGGGAAWEGVLVRGGERGVLQWLSQ